MHADVAGATMLWMAVIAREGHEVDAFLDTALAGTSALLIEGEPGIGKTTMWRSACEAGSAAGFHVISCRPGPAEVSLSFAALADLLIGIDVCLFDALPTVQRNALDTVLLRASASTLAVDERVVGVAVRSVLEQPQ